MDVMRGFFMQNYSFYEHALNPPDQTKHPGYYAFHGVKAAGRPGAEGLVQMGELLAKDPDFPVAWVQKLCNYVNSAPCDPEDSEFIRIVEFFKKSNFNWNAMMVEFFSSPLVTYEKSSNTVLKNKGLVSIARKKQLRNVLIFRNNLSEEYERYNHKTLPANKMKIWKDIEDILNSFPDNTYGRGMPIDMYPVEPGFILYKGMKNLCLLFSKLVVGTDNGIYASTSPNDSIKKMVKQFMGVHGEEGLMMEGFLKEYYDAAIQKGHPAMESLQSTFSLACQSPYITGVGI
jgi:hypothetical protein